MTDLHSIISSLDKLFVPRLCLYVNRPLMQEFKIFIVYSSSKSLTNIADYEAINTSVRVIRVIKLNR